MNALYNEWDDGAAAWIDALIDRGVLTAGPVITTDIEDVLPSDLKGIERVHLFAGIGTWDYALTLAGWPAGREVWTVSCPCQPFSAAGKRAGVADKRHLWPAVDWHIGQCRPHTIFGEQVASKDGRAWFDHVQSDLEARGYAVGAAVTPAAGYGAPHERHRNYFVATLADDDDAGPQGRRQPGCERGVERLAGASGLVSGLAYHERVERCRVTNPGGRDDGDRAKAGWHESDGGVESCGAIGGLAYNPSERRDGRQDPARSRGWFGVETGREDYMPGPTNGVWRDADWLGCRDDRWRPVEPGTFPLAHGSPARVGRLRGYGNGIVLPQAVAFIQSFLEGEAEWRRLRDSSEL